MPTDIKSLTREELEAQFTSWKQPAYRVTQLLEWLYARRAVDWDAMTNLPKPLREKLREKFSLHCLELVRQQGAPENDVTSDQWQATGKQIVSPVTRHLSHPADTTRKFLWKLADGSLIESVLIPANPALYGEASDRHTLCISTQVGCAYGCKFCASGLDGWKRNLTPDEIVEQVLAVERLKMEQVRNAECGMRNEAPAKLQPSTPHSALRTPR